HLAGQGGPAQTEVQLGPLTRLEVQGHARPGADPLLLRWPQVDPNADRPGRYTGELESAINVGDDLEVGLDPWPIGAAEGDRVDDDRGPADGLAAVAELAADRTPATQRQGAGIPRAGREFGDRDPGVGPDTHGPRLAGVGELEPPGRVGCCPVPVELVVQLDRSRRRGE